MGVFIKHFFIIYVLVLSGCSLVSPGNFQEDMIKNDKIHQEHYDLWIQKKGITEQSLIGMSKEDIKRTLGRVDKILVDWKSAQCQNKVIRFEPDSENCKYERWVYTNWYGVPFMSGFSTYVVYFNKNGIVERFDGYPFF